MAPSSLKLSFFWHMHQPDYRGSEGVMKMPWVFLHAIKDYYDMPWLLSRHPHLKATFNITPSLIEQLMLYQEPTKYDHFLSLWERHPSTLEEAEKEWIVKICKSTQYDTMVKKNLRFEALYHRKKYDDADFIDLETVFILAWCGSYLRQENPVVRELIEKKEGFTQNDKLRLLETLSAFIAEILPFYAALQKKGIIAVSTTPYYHPILPLLIDMDNARRANERCILPERPMSLRDDAVKQVRRSIDLYRGIFGCDPSGFWPAEGAVDEESIGIYKAHGIHWIATDEEILFRSVPDSGRNELYKPYRYKGMSVVFRDRELSDLIGFTYRFKPPRDAAEHFVRMVEKIAAEQPDATVFVIVDGENAWEFFEGGGYEFFMSLYSILSYSAWCSTVTLDEVSKEQGRELSAIAPGSWINANFDTWVGHFEKNRAWELIYQARRDVANYPGKIDDERLRAVEDHLLKAECSDWFWWYGDDHSTGFADEFDLLFRENLIGVYRLLKMPPPSNLFDPIISHRRITPFWVKPQNMISPVIDGYYRAFFDWAGCGSIDELKSYSTMDRIRGPISIILYGYDDANLYLAFNGDFSNRLDLSLTMIVEESGEQIVFPLQKSVQLKGITIGLEERLEIAVSRNYFQPFQSIHLRFELMRGERIIQTMPGSGPLPVDFGERYGTSWFV